MAPAHPTQTSHPSRAAPRIISGETQQCSQHSIIPAPANGDGTGFAGGSSLLFPRLLTTAWQIPLSCTEEHSPRGEAWGEAEHTCFMPMMWDRDGMHVPPGPGTGCVQDLGALQACLPSSGEFCIKSPNKQNVSLN